MYSFMWHITNVFQCFGVPHAYKHGYTSRQLVLTNSVIWKTMQIIKYKLIPFRKYCTQTPAKWTNNQDKHRRIKYILWWHAPLLPVQCIDSFRYCPYQSAYRLTVYGAYQGLVRLGLQTVSKRHAWGCFYASSSPEETKDNFGNFIPFNAPKCITIAF